jgi:hypothetical protein
MLYGLFIDSLIIILLFLTCSYRFRLLKVMFVFYKLCFYVQKFNLL